MEGKERTVEIDYRRQHLVPPYNPPTPPPVLTYRPYDPPTHSPVLTCGMAPSRSYANHGTDRVWPL
eukprot:3442908-Rhodomonas_salina.2